VRNLGTKPGQGQECACEGFGQTGEIWSAGSYLSQSDLRLHFGLGTNVSVSQIEVAWPAGGTQVFHNLAADRFYLIREGQQPIQQNFDAPGFDNLAPSPHP
jgi:ASPIC and UnbV